MNLRELRLSCPEGFWLVAALLALNVVVAGMSVVTNRDVIANEREIARKTNRFLLEIEEQQREQNIANSDYLLEFHRAVNARGEFDQKEMEHLDRIESMLFNGAFPNKKPEPKPSP